MSSAELVVLNNPTGMQKAGGLGINFKSSLFRLKPATININQPTTQAEGAIKGKLRLTPSGEQFDSLHLALMSTPIEQRQYYIGEQGSNRTPDNLMCFCRNVERADNKARTELQGPDLKSKVPQSLRCASCERSSWDKWRQEKTKENIPPCEAFYYATFINVATKLPMQMFIRSKSKQAFEKGMESITQLLYTMDAQGLNPNVFDVTFKLGTKGVANGKTTTYVLDMSNFKVITPEEREAFADVFARYGDSPVEDNPEADAAAQVEQTSQGIQNAVAAVVDDVPDAEIVV